MPTEEIATAEMTDLQERVKQSQAAFMQELSTLRTAYVVELVGVPIVMHPGVFPPRTDTVLMAQHLATVAKGKKVLDLGCGSGALSAVAGINGATGMASDINPTAVQNANDNFMRLGLKFDAIESDVYDSLEVKQYDLIVVTPPYAEGDVTDPLLNAYYGGRHFLLRLFARANEFLAKDGKVLICYPNWGDRKLFDAQVGTNGFTATTLGSKTSADGERIYYLHECTRIGKSKS